MITCQRTQQLFSLPKCSRNRPPCQRAVPRRALRRLKALCSENAAEEWSGYLPNCRSAAIVSLPGKQNGRAKPCGNQDAVLSHTVQPAPGVAATVLGVFDGHGRQGHVASARVKATMAEVLEGCARQALAAAAQAQRQPAAQQQQGWGAGAWLTNLVGASAMSTGAAALEFSPASAQSCLKETFAHATAAIRATASDFLQSGSTAVVCMLLQDSVVAAWTGDSRAVMGVADPGASSSSGYRAEELTRDHKPNDLHEMARIVAAGGKVARVAVDKEGRPTGPFRVFLPTVPKSPGLAVSRALGDVMLTAAGVIPDPDVSLFHLEPPSPAAATAPGSPAHILIVATDGLWTFVESQAAVDIAAACSSPEEAARRLLEAAQRSWEEVYADLHCDDISIAVAFL